MRGVTGPPHTNQTTTMKILLQHARNKLYFRRMNVWTSSPNEAFDFQHSSRAAEFAQRHDLADAQLLVKFDDEEWDEVFPLPLPKTEPPQQAA